MIDKSGFCVKIYCMSALNIVRISVVIMVLVNITNAYALACMQHLTDSHSASQNTHQAEQSHCDPHNNDAPPAAHCENLCFCEQAAHSPNLLADDKAESSIAVFKPLTFALGQGQFYSLDIAPPIPPPNNIYLA